MATVNKDFKIKSGLVVEGTTGTINGENILTTSQASTDHIVNIVGGTTLITSVDADQLVVTGGELSVLTNTFDAFGAADTAEASAKTYADGLATNYDPSGAATTAENNAKSYADSLATNYDPAGAAATAESNAEFYTDNAIGGLSGSGTASVAGNIDILTGTGIQVNGGNNSVEIDRQTVDTWYDASGSATAAQQAAELYADNAIAALVDSAPATLDTLNELAAALQDNPDIIGDLQSIAAGKQDTLTAGSNIDITGATISVTGLDSADISDFNTAALSATSAAYDAAGSADQAETDANSYTNQEITTALGTAQGYANTAEQNAKDYADALDTDDVAEGSTNLYLTEARVNDFLTTSTQNNISITEDVNGHLVFTAENGVAGSTTDDLAEGEENLYFTDERAIDAVSNADIYPNAVIIDNVAKQVAATLSATTAGIHVATAFAKADYRSAEFLVKVAYGDHTEISKVLLTLDVNDNIAITEYGIVGTNGSGMTVSAGISGTDVQLLVTTANNNSTVTAVGTLLV